MNSCVFIPTIPFLLKYCNTYYLNCLSLAISLRFLISVDKQCLMNLLLIKQRIFYECSELALGNYMTIDIHLSSQLMLPIIEKASTWSLVPIDRGSIPTLNFFFLFFAACYSSRHNAMLNRDEFLPMYFVGIGMKLTTLI